MSNQVLAHLEDLVNALNISLFTNKTYFSQSEIQQQIDILEDIKEYINKSESEFATENITEEALLNDILNNPESLTPFAISYIPADLKDEISLTDTDKFEIEVINLINKAKDKRMSLNNLLVALKLTTGIAYSRSILNNRLYRMVKKDILFSVPGRKGLYTTNRDIQYESNKEESREVDLYNEEIN
ncbi:hypothetical protein [Snodgrassella sp. W8132]|uniref:hypothetical protein n=1 Tax=Snodgrassella sp. W8132 TaxID=2750994 RepID=UPI0018DC9F26|nr:hypothetical protein [Snodgrassella sp. W8132]MBI0134140.1 hypothetical protein [Snodgrassella sp. W8132]